MVGSEFPSQQLFFPTYIDISGNKHSAEVRMSYSKCACCCYVRSFGQEKVAFLKVTEDINFISWISMAEKAGEETLFKVNDRIRSTAAAHLNQIGTVKYVGQVSSALTPIADISLSE